jgi:hypothetical protein
MAINSQLLLALVGSFIFVALYNTMVLLDIPIFFFSYFTLMVFWVLGCYLYLGNLLSRSFYVFGLSLCLPMISHPIEYLPEVISSGMDDLVLSYVSKDGVLVGDRIQIRSYLVSLTGYFLLAEVLCFLIKKNALIFLKVIVFCIAILLVVFMHSYDSYSLTQVFLDLGKFAGGAAICGFIRAEKFDNKFKERSWVLMSTVLAFLSVVVFFDILVTLTGLVGWSESYRGGLQGIFYAFEGPYSWIVGTVFVFTLAKVRYFSLPFCIILILGLTLLVMTNIKSAAGALFIAAVLLPTLRFKLMHRFSGPLFFIAVILMASVGINQESFSSIASRLGTYIAYASLFPYDFNWLIGYKPGVIEFVVRSNLAHYFISLDFSYLLSALSSNLIDEVVTRGTASDFNDAFLPHSVALALIASYGIVMLPPAFFYCVAAPVHFLRRINEMQESDLILFSILVYWIIFSHLHPIIFVIPIVLVTELIRKNINFRGMSGETGGIR